AGQGLSCMYRVQREREVAAGQILLHVLSFGGAGQRQNSDGAGEAEHDLGRRGVSARGQTGDQGMAWHLLIRGEKRESLIDDFALPAKQSHGAVPAEAGVATVLHECRKFGAGGCQLLQVMQRNIAYAEETGAAGIALFALRLPDL